MRRNPHPEPDPSAHFSRPPGDKKQFLSLVFIVSPADKRSESSISGVFAQLAPHGGKRVFKRFTDGRRQMQKSKEQEYEIVWEGDAGFTSCAVLAVPIVHNGVLLGVVRPPAVAWATAEARRRARCRGGSCT